MTIVDSYTKLYNGDEIKINIADGATQFKKTKCYEQLTLKKYEKTIKF
jgi:hypothetical protein